MQRKIALLLMAAILPVQVMAEAPEAAKPGMVLECDFNTARGVLDAFAKGSISQEDLTRLEATPGVIAMIQQTHQFSPNATAATFGSSLAAAIAHQPLRAEDDPFGLGNLEKNLPGATALMQELEQHGEQFGQDTLARLAPYAPKQTDMHVTVHFVLGGTSDGWATSDHDFYLALNYFKGDYQGLVVLTSHETYHVVQNLTMPETESKARDVTRRNAENLLLETFKEGTATVVGDPTQVKDGGAWIKWFSGKYASNQDHLADDYGLFNTMLYRAAHDPDVDYARLYSLGFSGGLGSALYFVGYNMSHVIMQYQGQAALAGYLGRPVREFFVAYMDLCVQHKDDSRCLPIDPEIARLIRSY